LVPVDVVRSDTFVLDFCPAYSGSVGCSADEDKILRRRRGLFLSCDA